MFRTLRRNLAQLERQRTAREGPLGLPESDAKEPTTMDDAVFVCLDTDRCLQSLCFRRFDTESEVATNFALTARAQAGALGP